MRFKFFGNQEETKTVVLGFADGKARILKIRRVKPVLGIKLPKSNFPPLKRRNLISKR
ncbi:MAG: hypothetical protein ACYCSQ_00235 [bacterium]